MVSKNSVKILYATPFDPSNSFGGVESFVKTLSSMLPEGFVPKFVFSLKSNKSRLRYFKEVLDLLMIRNMLQIDNVNLIHAQAWSSFPARYITKRRIPLISTAHGTTYGVMNNALIRSKFKRLFFKDAFFHEKIGFSGSDIVVSVSKRVGKEVVEGYNLDPKKIVTIYNGVDVDMFKPSDSEKEIDVLTVGRMDIDQKGLDILEKIFKKLPRRYIKVINGSSQYPIESVRVQRVPNISDLPGVYNSAKVFVQTSRYEGFSIALLEAMACEVPPVTFDRGGAPEAIRDGRDGFIVPFGDIKQMREKIEWLVEDESLRKRMGRSARKRVIENFSLDKMVSEYVKLYKELLE